MSLARCLAIVVLSLAGIGLATAQQYTHVSGLIQDASSAFVPAAAVSVVNEDTGFRRNTVSQPDGSYVLSSLLPGVYKITVRKPGFRTVIRFGVKLSELQPARVDFKLVVGSLQEAVTVEGTAPLLSAETAAVGTLVTRDEIEHLPLNGGGLLGLLELAPGLMVTPATRGESGQFTVNGQRPNTHYFTVDGASANSGVAVGGVAAQSTGGTLPGMTAFGSLDSLISVEAIQEAEVQTSSTVPEFGRMPGAQISLSSRAGSNEFHGAMVFGYRNQVLDANDWFANQQGDPRATLRLDDFVGTLGGPIWRDHTFFFASYEGLRLSEPFVSSRAVPSLAGREDAPAWVQPLLNLLPVPNGPDLGGGLAQWTGGVTRPARLDTGALRVDQAVGSRATLFARFSESPSSTEFGINPLNSLDLRSGSLTVGLNFRARPNLALDLRINGSRTSSSSVWNATGPNASPCLAQPAVAYLASTPGICNYLVRLSISSMGQIILGSEGRRSQSQFQIAQTTNLNLGTHSLRFGGDFRRLTPTRQDTTGSVNAMVDSLSDLAQNSLLWRGSAPLQDTFAVLQEASLFAEDTWRITPRLTMTYGLRWDISPAPQSNSSTTFLNVVTGTAVPLQQPLWHSSYTNFAPRFGIAYSPTKSGRTVLRAGGGFYYDSSLSLATDLINGGPLSVDQYSSNNAFVGALLTFGFRPDLRLPLVKQWNAAVEHAFDDHDVVSIGYVGSQGDRLIRRELGGVGSAQTKLFALATNDGESEYHSLQAQYRRRLARGVQALVSYSWSHSIDNSSSDGGLYWAGSGLTPSDDHASSDFDVRHSLSAGFTYEAPASVRWLTGWSLDGTFRARTGFPINVLYAEQYSGIAFENVFRPNEVAGQPLWISDPSAGGGKRINPNAFQAAASGVQGNLGRNAISGFGMSQFDLSFRREFSLGEKRTLQLRIEGFNAFNHANFADPVRYLASPLFGQSTSMLSQMLGTGSPGSGLAPIFQAGGARSVQAVLKFRF